MERILNEVWRDGTAKKIVVYNELYLYGEWAQKELSRQIAEDIENAWNEPQAQILIQGENYAVQFIFRGFVLGNDFQSRIENNIFPWRKFFRIVDNNSLNISFVDGLYGNTGQFLLKNIQKPNAKTAPHEIGHTWGLKHPPDTDYRGKGQPHIMMPRGTFVDPPYRYKPEAELYRKDDKWIMEEGFTVDTDKRKVLQLNIDDLQLDQLLYDDRGYANISHLTNRVH